jgi:transposase
MEHYAGIDVSLESASLCVVDATGRIVREAKVASEPEILIGWFRGLGLAMRRIGLEAGPLSQWLYAGMRGWRSSCSRPGMSGTHSRRCRSRPIGRTRVHAQLMRLGWFRPVHCKSLPAQEV